MNKKYLRAIVLSFDSVFVRLLFCNTPLTYGCKVYAFRWNFTYFYPAGFVQSFSSKHSSFFFMICFCWLHCIFATIEKSKIENSVGKKIAQRTRIFSSQFDCIRDEHHDCISDPGSIFFYIPCHGMGKSKNYARTHANVFSWVNKRKWIQQTAATYNSFSFSFSLECNTWQLHV